MENSTKNNEKRIVKFHIGRGGRFYNAGHLTFVGDDEISVGTAFEGLFYNEEEDQYYSEDGNPLHDELSQADVDSGVGVINEDHDYDTTYTKHLEDCNDREVKAIAKSQEWNRYEILKEFYADDKSINFEVLEQFDLIEEAFRDDAFDLEYFDIEKITKEEYDAEEDDDFEYVALSSGYFKKEL